jgi:hypothetical protein
MSIAPVGVQLVKYMPHPLNGPVAALHAGGRGGLGPDHIWISRVVGQVLRPWTFTPDSRPDGTDALHQLASCHVRGPVTGRSGRLWVPSGAGSGRPAERLGDRRATIGFLGGLGSPGGGDVTAQAPM